MTGSPVVLVGPKTRLGREVVAQLDGAPVLAIARDALDASQVAEIPGLTPADVVDASTRDLAPRVTDLGRGPLRVVVAALGPVHPETPRTSYDACGVVRDLGFVKQVVAAGRPVRIVFVSTVLALAPGPDRRYYGGWKSVVEQQLQQLVDECCAAGGDATLSVLYPGRLVDAAERRGRLRLHASYQALARRVLATSAEARSVDRTFGADSRIWLIVRSISFALRSLTPSTRRSVTPSPEPGVTERSLSGEGGY
ncbi:hypothetical protein L615_007700000100 [Nocardioides sp. J9]|uniref:hypothetical protein n=1 Tax=Nocardioides sp. J9 TaxID=935844 RepID=UPI00119E42AD|nr:hypothetical protein [Nocardioides sp. J9]TWG91854.1 hypothetical protein L615_007700000100 [Nocardioides sp. J9]